MNELGDDSGKSPMNDDEEKIRSLYKYRPALLAYLGRLGFSAEDAEDLTQNVFVRVCQSVHNYRGDAKLGFLKTIAKNLALNAIRDRHAVRRAGTHVPIETAQDVVDNNPGADVKAVRDEDSRRLRGAIELLNPPLKMTLLLLLSDMPYQQIATTLGISVPAVKSRLHEARQRLKELLGAEPEGLGGDHDQ
jgi:RNA polymerase sigma-70 factor, ECF subfamily